MAHRTRPKASPEHAETQADSQSRERTVGTMVSASLLAVLGTLIFAWALRSPDYPWLFAVGALPWLVGLVLFAQALWKYTHL